jgi:DNA polymerase-3 subunit delta'
MSWQGIQGHDSVVAQFRRSLSRGRLASTFLFVGPPGVGKRAFALKLAQTLLCSESPPQQMQPCGRCPSCVQVAAGTHPDLFVIGKPKERADIPVALLIGEANKRMQEGLCHDISLKPFMGGKRIAIIDDADHLNEEGANCLLKTLEEPPPQSVLILIATSAEKQLPTIRSRSQIIRFAPLEAEVLAELLISQGIVAEAAQARQLAEYSGGSLQRAAELADAELWEFRQNLLNQMAAARWDSSQLAKGVSAIVDAAGKEAPPRRARLRQVVLFAAELYRALARELAGSALESDAQMQSAVASAARSWPGDAELAGACALRCLDALEQIDANANQTTLIECWLDDLWQLQFSQGLVVSSQ